jgi:hypothetical protein
MLNGMNSNRFSSSDYRNLYDFWGQHIFPQNVFIKKQFYIFILFTANSLKYLLRERERKRERGKERERKR